MVLNQNGALLIGARLFVLKGILSNSIFETDNLYLYLEGYELWKLKICNDSHKFFVLYAVCKIKFIIFSGSRNSNPATNSNNKTDE